jgi:hypothetical protein
MLVKDVEVIAEEEFVHRWCILIYNHPPAPLLQKEGFIS